MRTSYLMFTVLIGGLGVWAQAPNAPSKDAPANELKGMPPRVAPTEYQAHAQAGTLTVAAEFLGHSVPTLEGTYNAEDYVVVEAALFGGPEARTKLRPEISRCASTARKWHSPARLMSRCSIRSKIILSSQVTM
jgi:hypothetical protein